MTGQEAFLGFNRDQTPQNHIHLSSVEMFQN